MASLATRGRSMILPLKADELLVDTAGDDGYVKQEEGEDGFILAQEWYLQKDPALNVVPWGFRYSRLRFIPAKTDMLTGIIDLAMYTKMSKTAKPSINRIIAVEDCIIDYRSNVGQDRTSTNSSGTNYNKRYGYTNVSVGIPETTYNSIISRCSSNKTPISASSVRRLKGYCWIEGSIEKPPGVKADASIEILNREMSYQVFAIVANEHGKADLQELGSLGECISKIGQGGRGTMGKNMLGTAFMTVKLVGTGNYVTPPKTFKLSIGMNRFQLKELTEIKGPALGSNLASSQRNFSTRSIMHSNVLQTIMKDYPSLLEQEDEEEDEDEEDEIEIAESDDEKGDIGKDNDGESSEGEDKIPNGTELNDYVDRSSDAGENEAEGEAEIPHAVPTVTTKAGLSAKAARKSPRSNVPGADTSPSSKSPETVPNTADKAEEELRKEMDKKRRAQQEKLRRATEGAGGSATKKTGELADTD